MIETHRARPYIENLRRDPRTKAMLDGWAVQATMAAEARNRGDAHDYRRMAHDAAREAIALAMAFVLDNDDEYQMVCEERDTLRASVLDAAFLRPATPLIVTTDAKS